MISSPCPSPTLLPLKTKSSGPVGVKVYQAQEPHDQNLGQVAHGGPGVAAHRGRKGSILGVAGEAGPGYSLPPHSQAPDRTDRRPLTGRLR